MRSIIVIALCFSALLTGCAKAPIEINRFDPLPEPPYTRTSFENNESYIRYDAGKYKVSAVLFESNSVFLLHLTIFNNTDTDIPAREYSVSLRDGRDLKTIRMLTRDDLAAARSKLAQESSPGGGIESQIITSTLNAIMENTSGSSKKIMLKGLDHAIDNYFSLRPIYAREKREGFLAFLMDFKAEYPITLMVKLKEEHIALKFLPRQKKEK